MKITFTNGTTLNPILITGGINYIQNANRDVLTFVFSETENMAELDNIFSATNCASIIIEENEDIYIHKGYTIRVGLEKKPIEIISETGIEPAITENRIFVKMAQCTYAETQVADLQETVDYLVLESLN